ncbi:MAG: GAF domain-containing protein, partial [Planctomycetota bacterium]
APHIRFYAGAPLHTHDGFNLGTLCAIDSKPRTLTDEQTAIFVDLANLVIEALEFRLSGEKALKE